MLRTEQEATSVAPGIATSNTKLLGAPGIATRSILASTNKVRTGLGGYVWPPSLRRPLLVGWNLHVVAGAIGSR